MKCPKCGFENPDNAKFCNQCANKLEVACHRHGKPFILHCCGQVDAIMEDLIETVGIDAKHSFQDNIEPVE